ncbi:MAG TPA: Arc family DNA-binding protein [Pseudorhizobium sp.]|jgi:hypothetical protein|nr:Arc family DNA-binding protein [Pseudorhizobium sp.]
MAENRSKSDQYQLRFPPGLRDRLKEAAEANGRSLNAEIIARIGHVISPDAEGWIRVYLPPGLTSRINEKANQSGTTPDVEIRFALEEAFPYVPTLRNYIWRLRGELDQAGKDADPGLFYFVRQAEELLETYPELGDRAIEVENRGWEVGPDEE